MGECYLGGASGKKTASGTFAGGGLNSHTESLDFTPKTVSCFVRYTGSSLSTPPDGVRIFSYSFDTNYGILFYETSGNNVGKNLYYDTALRPSFSGGVLTFDFYSIFMKFIDGYNYEWFASE